MVVYVVIALAAGLAFVVLFTLSTVNIGEREREIATIKVLGFRKREVRTYINKETLVLTLLGILVGLPAGWALSESFTVILKMPSIYFDVVVDPWCYALAAAFSTVFAIAVSRICNRMPRPRGDGGSAQERRVAPKIPPPNAATRSSQTDRVAVV